MVLEHWQHSIIDDGKANNVDETLLGSQDIVHQDQ